VVKTTRNEYNLVRLSNVSVGFLKEEFNAWIFVRAISKPIAEISDPAIRSSQPESVCRQI